MKSNSNVTVNQQFKDFENFNPYENQYGKAHVNNYMKSNVYFNNIAYGHSNAKNYAKAHTKRRGHPRSDFNESSKLIFKLRLCLILSIIYSGLNGIADNGINWLI
jgi:hypothetical protein